MVPPSYIAPHGGPSSWRDWPLSSAPLAPAQSAARQKPKGPRALGLVQLLPNGKARLVPITILYDGEFYDASAYKASPVPMALESGTVYEGVRTGVSQGLFTVTSALQGNNTWIGDGTWQSASAIAAAKEAAAKRREVMSKPAPEPAEGPPVLRRASAKPKPADDAPAAAPASSGPGFPPPASAPPTSAPAPSAPPPAAPDDDSDRPVLKRPAAEAAPTAPAPSPGRRRGAGRSRSGSPGSEARRADCGRVEKAQRRRWRRQRQPRKTRTSPRLPPAASARSSSSPPFRMPRAPTRVPMPTASSLKKNRSCARRFWLWRRTKCGPGRRSRNRSRPQRAPRPSRPGSKAKSPQPTFEDVQLHAFDLSNSNEPCWC